MYSHSPPPPSSIYLSPSPLRPPPSPSSLLPPPSTCLPLHSLLLHIYVPLCSLFYLPASPSIPIAIPLYPPLTTCLPLNSLLLCLLPSLLPPPSTYLPLHSLLYLPASLSTPSSIYLPLPSLSLSFFPSFHILPSSSTASPALYQMQSPELNGRIHPSPTPHSCDKHYMSVNDIGLKMSIIHEMSNILYLQREILT